MRKEVYFSSTIFFFFALISTRILTWSFGIKGNCESLTRAEREIIRVQP